jgi:hypothetical protein
MVKTIEVTLAVSRTTGLRHVAAEQHPAAVEQPEEGEVIGALRDDIGDPVLEGDDSRVMRRSKFTPSRIMITSAKLAQMTILDLPFSSFSLR